MQIYNSFINFTTANHLEYENNFFYMLENAALTPSSFQYYLEFDNNQGRKVALHSNAAFESQCRDRRWLFSVHDVLSLMWKHGENRMSYRLHQQGSMKLLHYWLSHAAFPMYLVLEKHYYFLHVGSVRLGNHAVAFMADSFGGKSTLTDYFLQKNHALVTDDKLATYEKNGSFYAVPSYPFHRPYREMETLGRYVENFESTVLRLGVVYVLKKAAPDADIEISIIKGMEKFRQLRYGSEMDFSFVFERGVQYLARLASQVPMYAITVPWDMRRLNDVYNAIAEHQKNLTSEQ